MKNSLFYFFLVLLFFSCETNDKAYSYLCEADTDGETVDIVYKNLDNALPFRYTIQSREMCIQWGYDNDLTDYIFMGKIDSITSIKALEHSFPATGDYSIKIKALGLRGLDLSKEGVNEITNLRLTKCDNLERLFCLGQPISTIDLSACPILKQLSCGFSDGTLTLSDLSKISELQSLEIGGYTNYRDLNLSENKKLEAVLFDNSNLIQLNLSSLSLLSSLKINNCSSLDNLLLSNNPKLMQLVLTNNSSLSADVLDDIFESLPHAQDTNSVILLRGNLGDDTCDRTLATDKGWTFVESL